MSGTLRQHLDQLGLDVDLILSQIPDDLTLSCVDGVLFVCHKNENNLKAYVDFLNGAITYRINQHVGGEHLIRACKVKSDNQIHVLDATCGMGKDSFLLQNGGFKVTATEKNPIIHALLADGLSRYQLKTGSKAFDLFHFSAEHMMKNQTFDVIYLDPMFPHKAKSAKAKKDMQLFQRIHQDVEDNAAQLLALALSSGCKRVVIKRPLNAKQLASYVPTFQMRGKTCRFDAFQLN